jgi:DsbC/DsbD-like thiol-disulfide interchange protein
MNTRWSNLARLVWLVGMAVNVSAQAQWPPTSPFPAEPEEELVRAVLLADRDAITPGKPFTLGVLLEMKPQWHIYWKNPGEAGMATRIRVKAPEDFRVGELHWPAPQRHVQPGEITDYGYDGQVLLWMEIMPPETLSKTQYTLEVEASWLACFERCVPGKAGLSITLPVASEATPANQELFSAWAALEPVAAGADNAPASAKARGLMDESGNGDFTLQVNWDFDPKKVEVFPPGEDGLEVIGLSVRTMGRVSTATFHGRQLPGLHRVPETTEFIFTAYTPQGRRQAVAVSVPLRKPASPPAGHEKGLSP